MGNTGNIPDKDQAMTAAHMPGASTGVALATLFTPAVLGLFSFFRQEVHGNNGYEYGRHEKAQDEAGGNASAASASEAPMEKALGMVHHLLERKQARKHTVETGGAST